MSKSVTQEEGVGENQSGNEEGIDGMNWKDIPRVLPSNNFYMNSKYNADKVCELKCPTLFIFT